MGVSKRKKRFIIISVLCSLIIGFYLFIAAVFYRRVETIEAILVLCLGILIWTDVIVLRRELPKSAKILLLGKSIFVLSFAGAIFVEQVNGGNIPITLVLAGIAIYALAYLYFLFFAWATTGSKTGGRSHSCSSRYPESQEKGKSS